MTFQTKLMNSPYRIEGLTLSDALTLSWSHTAGIKGFLICTHSGCTPAPSLALLMQLDDRPCTQLRTGACLSLYDGVHCYQMRYHHTNSLSFAALPNTPPMRYQVFPVVETADKRIIYLSPCQLNQNAILQPANIQVCCTQPPFLIGYTQCTVTSTADLSAMQPDDWLLYYRVGDNPEKIPVPQTMMHKPFLIPAPQNSLNFSLNERYHQIIHLITN